MAGLIEVFRSLINDYEETFWVMENGTIKANNENFERVQNFLNRYDALLRFDGLEVGAVNIEIVGYGEIEKVNRNKKEMVKLLGSTNQLYLKACRGLSVQPNRNYINLIITDQT